MKRIVVIGDSTATAYGPVLKASLKDEAEVWLAPREAQSSVDLLVGATEYVLQRQPEIVVFASGILDTRKICFGENERVVPLTTFARNVRCVLKTALEHSASTPVWLTMPPVDGRKASVEAEFGYDNDTISLYNEEAKAVARMLQVEIIDLYGIVKASSRTDSNRPDGIRFDQQGSDFLAKSIAARLRELCARV